MGAYIAKMLLPVISSLVYLPLASVASKRGFHMEAMVYFFTMFFTAIFHACDGSILSILCFMKYDLLEYFTIFGTALSIWVSLLALADFDEPRRSTLNMFGVLTCAVRIYQDRVGYGVYSGPIGTAVLMITFKWLQKMKETRGLYPEKKVYTQQVGPGCCFGALALMLRYYFEEWDYAYVHSFYHLSLAVSFVLLLPKKNRYAGDGRNAAKLSCYTLCCCVIFPASDKQKKDKGEKSIWKVPTLKDKEHIVEKDILKMPSFKDKQKDKVEKKVKDNSKNKVEKNGKDNTKDKAETTSIWTVPKFEDVKKDKMETTILKVPSFKDNKKDKVETTILKVPSFKDNKKDKVETTILKMPSFKEKKDIFETWTVPRVKDNKKNKVETTIWNMPMFEDNTKDKVERTTWKVPTKKTWIKTGSSGLPLYAARPTIL